MNSKLKIQRLQMQIAINALDLIEVCDENINMGHNVADYVLRKQQYVEKYAEVMGNIVGEAVTISKVELFNEL